MMRHNSNTDRQVRRLFVDMDGTLCEWKPAERFEDMYEPGWFSHMSPNITLVNALKCLYKTGRCEIYILSAVLSDSPYAQIEKDSWLDKHFPDIDKEHRIFVSTKEPKYNAVPGGIRSDDILLDDYSKNLHEWAEKAIAIKYLNGINGTGGTWKSREGAVLDGCASEKTILEELILQINNRTSP